MHHIYNCDSLYSSIYQPSIEGLKLNPIIYINKMDSAKVFVFGLKNAGKSTIVNYLKTKVVSTKMTPTLSIAINSLKIKDKNYSIWDAPGQKKLISTWEKGFYNADILLLVIDIDNKADIDESKKILESFKGTMEKIDTPLIIVLHKMDLITTRANVDYVKSIFHLDNENYQTFYIETTIKAPETIELLRFLLEICINRDFQNKNFDFLKMKN